MSTALVDEIEADHRFRDVAFAVAPLAETIRALDAVSVPQPAGKFAGLDAKLARRLLEAEAGKSVIFLSFRSSSRQNPLVRLFMLTNAMTGLNLPTCSQLNSPRGR